MPFTHTKNYVDGYKNNNNGRSHGKKMQKLRKFYHMFYLKKSQKTHLKVYGKNTGKLLTMLMAYR